MFGDGKQLSVMCLIEEYTQMPFREAPVNNGTPTYRVKDWSLHFEVSQSKRAKSPGKLSWVAVPNRHDGKSYKRLLRMQDGLAMYGAWQLIVQIASKCPERGLLRDEDGPIDAEVLSLKTEGTREMFEKALNVLSSKDIGWLQLVEDGFTLRAGSEHTPSAVVSKQDTDVTDVTDVTVRNDTKRDETNVGAARSTSSGEICRKQGGTGSKHTPTDDGEIWGRRGAIRYDATSKAFTGISDEHKTRWRAAYPRVNLDNFLVMIASKVWANRTGWGRKSDYEKALENWLCIEQDRGNHNGNGTHRGNFGSDRPKAGYRSEEQAEDLASLRERTVKIGPKAGGGGDGQSGGPQNANGAVPT